MAVLNESKNGFVVSTLYSLQFMGIGKIKLNTSDFKRITYLCFFVSFGSVFGTRIGDKKDTLKMHGKIFKSIGSLFRLSCIEIIYYNFSIQRKLNNMDLRYPIHINPRFNESECITYMYGLYSQYTWT